MNKKLILIGSMIVLGFIKSYAQDQYLRVDGTNALDKPNTVTDWNLLWQSGFYDGSSTLNAPEASGWFWGINMNHKANGPNYRYNGQIAIKNSPSAPTLYFRSTNANGVGVWAKVLHDYGNQQINGNLSIGLTNDNSYSKFVIKGPNKPLNIGSKRDISFEFLAAGAAVIRSYRGGSWDTYLQFLTTPSSGGGLQTRMHINHNGDIGIGTTTPDAKLTVNGDIHTEEVRVDVTGALVPDYVFADDYQLPALEEIENYINTHKHLPEVPSASEMEKEGMKLKEMNLLLLKKVEELTLYVIELKKENEKQERSLNEQQIIINQLLNNK